MLIEKSRIGVYQDTSENRRLHRVGQRYGEAKKPEEKKDGDNAKGGEIATSKAGIKAFLSGKVGGDYYRAVAEAYNALRRSGKSKTVDLMLKESGSGSPSKDIPAKKYVEAVNDGATHDEAVAFADDCYEELLAKIQNVQEKVHSEGVSTSASTKMFAAVNKWFNAQKFDKKNKGFEKQVELPSSKNVERILAAINGNEFAMKKLSKNDVLGEVRVLETRRKNAGIAGSDPDRFASMNKEDLLVCYKELYDDTVFYNKTGVSELASAARKQAEKIDRGVRVSEEKRHLEEIKRTNEKMNAAMKEQPNSDVKSAEMSEKPTSRVTFADVPHAKDVNLKKYLTDSRRKDVDRLMQATDGMPKTAIKHAHDAAVAKFNENFDSMKKSERASALYVIMKYKDLMNKAKSSADRNKVAREDIIKRMSDAKVSFGSIE